ncbi:MAG: hypothetical protein OJF52_003276 [Nitrospira sp.]|nr:MAG: hypothetical protein OJF52_003276 [Nitrospira sp.]
MPGETSQRANTYPRILTCCLLIAFLQGCVSGLHVRDASDDEDEITESHCVPATNQPTEVVTLPAVVTASRIDTASRPTVTEPIEPSRFSPRAREIAAIIGVQGLLAEFQLLEEEMARGLDGASLRSLAVRQELSDRLLLALFEANSISAELECEKARAEDLASRLEEIRNDVQQGRTVMAILADSISGVFAGTFLLLGSEILSGLIDLSGSVAALGFGVAALDGDQAYEFTHGRNLMADVWYGNESSRQFPHPVWRYLNGPVRPNGKRSRRDNIIGSWRARLGKPGSKEERRLVDLFFGKGGVYRINELRYRSEMLGLLKTHVNLMTQDLNLLFLETLHHRPSRLEEPV